VKTVEQLKDIFIVNFLWKCSNYWPLDFISKEDWCS